MKNKQNKKNLSPTATAILNGLTPSTGLPKRTQRTEEGNPILHALPPGPANGQGYARLIRIARKEDRVRAIGAFLRVPKARCSFSDFRFLVTHEHIAALLEDGIPFEDITDTP